MWRGSVNAKFRVLSKIELVILRVFLLERMWLVASGFIPLSIILMVQLRGQNIIWWLKVLHNRKVLII